MNEAKKWILSYFQEITSLTVKLWENCVTIHYRMYSTGLCDDQIAVWTDK